MGGGYRQQQGGPPRGGADGRGGQREGDFRNFDSFKDSGRVSLDNFAIIFKKLKFDEILL